MSFARLTFLVLAACSPALVPAVACSPFTAADDPDASSDASFDAAAAEAASDADAGAASTPCVSPTCEDFETTKWTSSWMPSGTGVSVSSGPSTSGTKAIDLLLPGNSGGFYWRALGGARHVSVTLQMKVFSPGTGEVDFISISEQPMDSKGVHVAHSNSTHDYVFEIPVNTGKGTTELATSFDVYTPVTIDLDLNLHSCKVTIGNALVPTNDLDPSWAPSALYLLVGASFAANVTQPWHVRFDDAAVTTLP